MKALQFFLLLIYFSPINGQTINEFIELDSEDPLNILLSGLKDKSLYPPQNHEEWSSGQLIKQLFADYKYSDALEVYKENFGSKWAYSDASFYALSSASKIDSVDWFLKVYSDCPPKIQEKWKYQNWNPLIIQKLGTKKHMDSLDLVKAKNLDKELNDMLTLILLEDISIRTNEGKMDPPQWVKGILEEDGISYLLNKIRNLPFPELSKSHWKQLDSLLTENPELNLENIGFLAKTGLEMSLLHANPSNLPKYYQFIRDNFRPDLIGYFVDKALLKRDLPQIFATQVDMDKKRRVFTWQAIHDFENVDKFRMRIGMSTLKQYSKICNLNYEQEFKFHQRKLKD